MRSINNNYITIRVSLQAILYFFLAVILLSMLARPAQQAKAETYDVTASVPYAVPTQAPVIDASFDGKVVTTSILTITGDCQVLSPYSIVSIWRAGTLIGSGLCSASGRFGIEVSLLVGANELLPKISNISSVYGPDGSRATINYTPPKSAPSPPTPLNLPTITTDKPLAITGEANEVSITVTIGGGTAPYELTINWGDGSEEVKKFPGAGTYTLNHTYAEAGTYILKAILRDVLGASTELVLPVVHPGGKEPSPTPTSATTGTQQKTPACGSLLNRWYGRTGLVIGLGAVYFLGRWHGIRLGRKRGGHEQHS